MYHVESRWCNSNVLVYHDPLTKPFFGSCAIYFHDWVVGLSKDNETSSLHIRSPIFFFQFYHPLPSGHVQRRSARKQYFLHHLQLPFGLNNKYEWHRLIPSGFYRNLSFRTTNTTPNDIFGCHPPLRWRWIGHIPGTMTHQFHNQDHQQTGKGDSCKSGWRTRPRGCSSRCWLCSHLELKPRQAAQKLRITCSMIVIPGRLIDLAASSNSGTNHEIACMWKMLFLNVLIL